MKKKKKKDGDNNLGFKYYKEIADLVDADEYRELFKSGKIKGENKAFLKQFLKEFYSPVANDDLKIHTRENKTPASTHNARRRALHASKVPDLTPAKPNCKVEYGDLNDYARFVTQGTPEDLLLAKEEYEESSTPAANDLLDNGEPE